MATNSIDPYQIIADSLGVSPTWAIILLSVISLWTIIWKGFALWKSSKKDHLVWFVILLIFNTLGILEILYIFVFSKMSLKKIKTENNKKEIKVKKNKK